MNYLNLFSKFNCSFYFGVGLWFLIGWLNPSSAGLSCYDCTYQAGFSTAIKACINPVKDKAPTIQCPPTSKFCKKSTELQYYPPNFVSIKLTRECDDGPSVCKTNTRMDIALPEVINGQPIYAYEYADLIRKWKLSDGFQSVSARTCTGDNCNDEPTEFTTTCQQQTNGSNSLVNQSIIWANIILVTILTCHCHL